MESEIPNQVPGIMFKEGYIPERGVLYLSQDGILTIDLTAESPTLPTIKQIIIKQREII